MTLLGNQRIVQQETPSAAAILVRAAAFSILALLFALVATSAARYFDAAPQTEAAQLLLGP